MPLFRESIRFDFKAFRVAGLLLALGALALPATAQDTQDNRQLQRDATQQANQSAQRRIALVIGNGAYTNAPPLKNPPNDVRDMAATLKVLGFEVTSGVNVNQRDMKRLIREFGQKLKGGGSGLFYFAGHGVQSKGKNYLIPIEADIQSEIEVEDSGVDVNLVLGYMDDAQNGLNIVILDACRNNPFARSFRSASNGLAQVDAPTGTLIAYATAPGRVASDGTGQNGLYTSELLKQMQVAGVSVTDMFMRVRAEVMKQTRNSQVPWESSSLVGSFYFGGAPSDDISKNQNTTTKPIIISEAAKESAFWEAVKDSTNPQDFRDYLAKYPRGAYASAARIKLRQLANPKANAAPPQTSNPQSTVPYPNASSLEDLHWGSAKDRSVALLVSYLKQYPNGKYAAEARRAFVKASGVAAPPKEEPIGVDLRGQWTFQFKQAYDWIKIIMVLEQEGSKVYGATFWVVSGDPAALPLTGTIQNGQLIMSATYKERGNEMKWEILAIVGDKEMKGTMWWTGGEIKSEAIVYAEKQ